MLTTKEKIKSVLAIGLVGFTAYLLIKLMVMQGKITRVTDENK